MVQLVDHPFDGGNITVLRSRVQFSFLPLESAWNLVGMILSPGQIWVGSH